MTSSIGRNRGPQRGRNGPGTGKKLQRILEYFYLFITSFTFSGWSAVRYLRLLGFDDGNSLFHRVENLSGSVGASRLLINHAFLDGSEEKLAFGKLVEGSGR